MNAKNEILQTDGLQLKCIYDSLLRIDLDFMKYFYFSTSAQYNGNIIEYKYSIFSNIIDIK